MLILLSPSKTLDPSPPSVDLPTTEPQLGYDIAVLLKRCRKLSPRSLRRLMKLSEPLAELNHQRFQELTWPLDPVKVQPSLLTFSGDVYRGLDAATLSTADLAWAQDRLRIISGFYGLLRPLDRMQPYRLEMGCRLSNTRGKNLYEFWKNRLADSLNEDHAARPAQAVLNLASQEYFRAVPAKRLDLPVITANFQEERDGGLRTIGFFAKRARGLMARHVIQNRIDDPAELESFAEEGYRFRADLSDDGQLLFTRSAQQSA